MAAPRQHPRQPSDGAAVRSPDAGWSAVSAPALQTKLRCRMHGGKSSGPRTLDGLARIRAARTQHGRRSAVQRTFERWRRQYVANGYRSARAMPEARMRAYFLRLAAEPIPAGLLWKMRQAALDEVVRREAERVRALSEL